MHTLHTLHVVSLASVSWARSNHVVDHSGCLIGTTCGIIFFLSFYLVRTPWSNTNVALPLSYFREPQAMCGTRSCISLVKNVPKQKLLRIPLQLHQWLHPPSLVITMVGLLVLISFAGLFGLYSVAFCPLLHFLYILCSCSSPHISAYRAMTMPCSFNL